MFDGTSRSEPAAARAPSPAAPIGDDGPRSGVPMAGVLALAFHARDGETALGKLYQRAPCRALFPRVARGEPKQAVVVNVAGGLVGGDSIRAQVTAGAGSRVLVTSQAAEKIYRSAGRPVRVATGVAAQAGAVAEWMPQPTILFDGAELVRHIRLDVAAGATLLAGEVTILGRAARGERLTRGSLFDAWAVYRDGRLVWADRTRVDRWADVLDDPNGFDGAAATALLVCAAPDAGVQVDRARSLLDAAGVAAAATVIDGLLILRWLGRDAARLVAAYADFWRRFRALFGAGAAVLPTIWQG
jgi:urease accessory protein